jgi:hypothetical protein
MRSSPKARRGAGRGAFHVLSLLLPYLDPGSRDHLRALAGRTYINP